MTFDESEHLLEHHCDMTLWELTRPMIEGANTGQASLVRVCDDAFNPVDLLVCICRKPKSAKDVYDFIIDIMQSCVRDGLVTQKEMLQRLERRKYRTPSE